MHKHTCYLCNGIYEWGHSPETVKDGKTYCAACRKGFLDFLNAYAFNAKTGQVFVYDGEPGWSRADDLLQALEVYKTSLPRPNRGVPELVVLPKRAASVDEGDVEEARLRAILTRPADKSYCPCGISREQCTYHKPLSGGGPMPATIPTAVVDWVLKNLPLASFISLSSMNKRDHYSVRFQDGRTADYYLPVSALP